MFRKYGQIVEEETFVKPSSGKYGFVRFVARADAERAKAELNRQIVGSRAMSTFSLLDVQPADLATCSLACY